MSDDSSKADKLGLFQKVLDAFAEGRTISRKDLHLLQDLAYRLTETDDVRRFRLKLLFVKDIVIWISFLATVIFVVQYAFDFIAALHGFGRIGNSF